jgi:hypothetical protein
MTARELVKAECANLVEDRCVIYGSCRVKGERAGADRRVMERPKRCGYFERCVMALGELEGLANREKYLKAANGYRDLFKLRPASPARYCECGKPLFGKHRLCPECKTRHNRETSRASTRRIRSRRKSAGLKSGEE